MAVQVSNKDVAYRWFTEGWNGNLALAEETFAPNPTIDGKEYTLDFIVGNYRDTLTAFPDLQTTVDHQVEQGDWVVTRYTMRGSNQNAWRGIPANGTPITAAGISMFRFENGKVVEAWDRFDMFGLMLQINAIPMPLRTECRVQR